MPDYIAARDKRYLYPEEPLHIVGRDWCFEWYQSDIDKVIKLWNGGYSLEVIAKGKIGKRIGYLWGVG